MYLSFYYVKIDPQYYFFRSVLHYYYFARLLELKKIYRGSKM